MENTDNPPLFPTKRYRPSADAATPKGFGGVATMDVRAAAKDFVGAAAELHPGAGRYPAGTGMLTDEVMGGRAADFDAGDPMLHAEKSKPPPATTAAARHAVRLRYWLTRRPSTTSSRLGRGAVPSQQDGAVWAAHQTPTVYAIEKRLHHGDQNGTVALTDRSISPGLAAARSLTARAESALLPRSLGQSRGTVPCHEGMTSGEDSARSIASCPGRNSEGR